MKKVVQSLKTSSLFIIATIFAFQVNAQTLEWRLVSAGYNSADPDGAGPAKASVSFTLQVHTTSGTVTNINTISTGWSYQLTNHMVPTGASGPGCPSQVSNPANVVVSPTFGTDWHYNTVNECGVAPQVADTKIFDTRAVGTFEGNPTSITTTWVDMFTVTLWSVGVSDEGYVIINSGEGGAPGEFPTYTISDEEGTSFATNSLTYTTPLRLGPPLPVGLSKFDITCTGNGAKLNWQTASEQNSKNFEVQKSSNGASGWTSIGTLSAAGNSNIAKQYEYYDLKGGSAYYRLRQVDKDGQYTYSGVQNVSCKSRSNNILLYPVPAKNTLNVVLSTERETKATILLVDISGKIMRQVRTDLQKGMNNLKVNVAGLSSGEYILKVVGSEVFNTQKVTIIN
jgi:hypothetical protein